MNSDSDNMRADYADSLVGKAGMRGKYFEAAMRAKRMVQIDEDFYVNAAKVE